MIEGDLRGRINLRPHDDIKEMASRVNTFKDLLERRIKRVNDITQEMEKSAHDSAQSTDERLTQNLALAHAIRSELEFFRLSGE